MWVAPGRFRRASTANLRNIRVRFDEAQSDVDRAVRIAGCYVSWKRGPVNFLDTLWFGFGHGFTPNQDSKVRSRATAGFSRAIAPVFVRDRFYLLPPTHCAASIHQAVSSIGGGLFLVVQEIIVRRSVAVRFFRSAWCSQAVKVLPRCVALARSFSPPDNFTVGLPVAFGSPGSGFVPGVVLLCACMQTRSMVSAVCKKFVGLSLAV